MIHSGLFFPIFSFTGEAQAMKIVGAYKDFNKDGKGGAKDEVAAKSGASKNLYSRFRKGARLILKYPR